MNLFHPLHTPWSHPPIQQPTWILGNRKKKHKCTHTHTHTFIILHTPLRILVLDLSDPTAVRKATEKAKQLFGQIDMLVNNGGEITYVCDGVMV